jgi:hypothetical protein
MPDAEASPLLPNEAPAGNSIKGEPLRMKNNGPAGCRPAASCLFAARHRPLLTNQSRAAQAEGRRGFTRLKGGA